MEVGCDMIYRCVGVPVCCAGFVLFEVDEVARRSEKRRL